MTAISRRRLGHLMIGTMSASVARHALAVPTPKMPRGAEIRSLRLFAEKTHPRACEARSDPDWQVRWNRLEQIADTLTDGSYFMEARRALAWFGDGHTTILPFEFTGGVPETFKAGPFGLTLPFRARAFDDGVFIVSATDSRQAILGAEIARVGNADASTLIMTVAREWPGNLAWAHRWAAMPFSRPALLQGLGAIGDPAAPIPFALLRNGQGQAVRLAPDRKDNPPRVDVARLKTDRENWAGAAGRGNYVRLLADRRAIYVSIDEMADSEGMSFERLTREMVSAFDHSETDRLIIDLRRNGGGNNLLGEPMRKIIGASRFNRWGGLYLLIGPQTFSAAQNLANRLERETLAIFVGTPTGGAPNHYGDATLFVGEATGISAIISTLPWFDSSPQDKRPWIMPDIIVPDRFSDWIAGRDSAFERAVSHQPEGHVALQSTDRSLYFQRPSQAAIWRPFWNRT